MNGKFLKIIKWIYLFIYLLVYLLEKDPPRTQQARHVLKLQWDIDYIQLNTSPEEIGSTPYSQKTKFPAQVMEFNVLKMEFLVEYNY